MRIEGTLMRLVPIKGNEEHVELHVRVSSADTRWSFMQSPIANRVTISDDEPPEGWREPRRA